MFKKLLITMVAACLLLGNLQAKSQDFDAVLTDLYLSPTYAGYAMYHTTINNITVGEGEWLASHYPNLKVLDLSKNRLRRLPESISGLTKLEELRIGDNRFFRDEYVRIKGSFTQGVKYSSGDFPAQPDYSV